MTNTPRIGKLSISYQFEAKLPALIRPVIALIGRWILERGKWEWFLKWMRMKSLWFWGYICDGPTFRERSENKWEGESVCVWFCCNQRYPNGPWPRALIDPALWSALVYTRIQGAWYLQPVYATKHTLYYKYFFKLIFLLLTPFSIYSN